ncbi:MAG TPA: TonB-dependent receptor [Candidatus Polarisedimenticolaceae bacterium]|nr:TonB-dependent receptor [Candidatus Polarisedimenticolaceae bacterium]
MRIVRAVIATFSVAAAISVVSAQSGGIEVTVLDSEGQPLPAATVTISHPTGYVKETAQLTNKDGVVAFPVLRATGSSVGYNINVAFPGFASMQLTDIKVNIGRTNNLPIQLQAEITETVTVTATTDVVDLENTEQTTKFTDEFIQDLPVPGRFYQNVLTLAPGVQDPDGDGNPNVHGSRDRDFKAEVSGMSNVDPLTGQQMSQVNPNSIEEMEVITAGAGVEFSRAQGGFARILQKQGSNDLEGVFEMYYSSSLLDGTGAQDFNNTTDPDFDSFQPGFQLSGPIVKDKLWYRLSHQYIKREDPTNTVSGLEVVTDEWGIHSDAITWQVSPRNKLQFQIQLDPRTITNFGVTSTRPAEAAQIREFGSDTYSLTWTAPYSPKILIQSQVGYQERNLDISPTSATATNNCVTAPDLAFLETAQCFNTQTGEWSGSFNQTWNDARKRLTFRGDTTVYAGRFLGATHQFKFGMSIENENYTRDLYQRPVVFYSQLTFQDPTRPQDDPVPKILIDGTFAAPDYTSINAKGVNWGFYAEDQFKPAQNLTVTLGVRIDREEIRSNGKVPIDPEAEFQNYLGLVEAGDPVNAHARSFTAYEDPREFVRTLASQLGIDFNTLWGSLSNASTQSEFWPTSRANGNVDVVNTNPAPRLALSWDPWSNGKTKVFATAGRYYDKIFLGVPLIELNPPTTNLNFESFIDPNNGRRVVQLNEAVKAAVNVNTVDRDLETPYNDEWTLGFEREIATETSLRVTYVNRRFRNQLQDLDLNHAPGDYGRDCNPRGEPTFVVPVQPADPGYDPRYAPGDGVYDDCVGRIEFDRIQSEVVGGNGGAQQDEAIGTLEFPDGFADLYGLNPGWGDMYLVGNLNRIDYEGLTIELIRRQYRSWEMTGSYTLSEAFGDGEDFQQNLGDDRSTIEDEQGYQAYDRRHAVKVAATSITPWGFRLGANLTWQSGLPYSLLTRQVSFDAAAPPHGTLAPVGVRRQRTTYDTGQRNDQRNDSFWNLDLKLTKEMNVGRKLNMQLSAEIFNALADDTYTIYDPINQVGEQVNGVNTAFRRFGRRWQLGVRFSF